MGVLAQMMKIPAFFPMNRSATGSTAPTCTLFLKRNRDTSSWAVAQMGCRVVYLSVLLAHTVEKIDKVTDKQTKTKEEKKKRSSCSISIPDNGDTFMFYNLVGVVVTASIFVG